MKSKLTNYSKSVWTGKPTSSGCYGLRSAAAKLGVMPGDDTKSMTSSLSKTIKGNSAKEAERIQAKSKIVPQVVETIEKGDMLEKRRRDEENQKTQQEEKLRLETESRDKVAQIKDEGFSRTQQSIAMNYTNRNLANPNLLNKQEELRRIKSEFEDEKLKMQKNNSDMIAQLEKKKGVTFKSKSSNQQFLPVKEDIIVDKKEARDLIFDGDKKMKTISLTSTKWEKEDLKSESLKYKEPENSEDYYNLKYDTKEIYGWSCQANCESFLEKVKSDLGDRDYNRLRDLFECYAGAVSPLQMGKIESYQFHQFLKDHELYTEKFDKTQADLKFCAYNKSKSLNFEGFCRILFELALDKYPWEKNRSIALPYFVRHCLFSKKFYEKEKKFEKVIDELYSPDVQEYLNNSKEMEYYSQFFSNNCKKMDVDDKTKEVIDLRVATKISIDLRIIPDLILMINFVKLFKQIQTDLDVLSKSSHRDYLDREEFKKLIAAVGIYAYLEEPTLKAKFPKSVQKVASIMSLYTKE